MQTLRQFLSGNDFHGKIGFVLGGNGKLDYFFRVKKENLNMSTQKHYVAMFEKRIQEHEAALSILETQGEKLLMEDSRLKEAIKDESLSSGKWLMYESLKEELQKLQKIEMKIKLQGGVEKSSGVGAPTLSERIASLECQIKEFDEFVRIREEKMKIINDNTSYMPIHREIIRIRTDIDWMEHDINNIKAGVIDLVVKVMPDAMNLEQIHRTVIELKKTKSRIDKDVSTYHSLQKKGVYLRYSLEQCQTTDEIILFNLHKQLPENEWLAATSDEEKLANLRAFLKSNNCPIPYKIADCTGKFVETEGKVCYVSEQLTFVKLYQAMTRSKHIAKVKAKTKVIAECKNPPAQGQATLDAVVGPVFDISRGHSTPIISYPQEEQFLTTVGTGASLVLIS